MKAPEAALALSDTYEAMRPIARRQYLKTEGPHKTVRDEQFVSKQAQFRRFKT